MWCANFGALKPLQKLRLGQFHVLNVLDSYDFHYDRLFNLFLSVLCRKLNLFYSIYFLWSFSCCYFCKFSLSKLNVFETDPQISRRNDLFWLFKSSSASTWQTWGQGFQCPN
uniref:Candidate secreted effector n=1 Tax=Meloidogyne incognita TaxID=6306 RepID=A0A914KFT8_MELIC